VTSVAMLLANVITGEVWKYQGARVPFYLASAIAAVSAVLLMISRRKQVISTN